MTKYWPPIGWKTTILVCDWSPVHPDLCVLEELSLQRLVMGHAGPGLGQQNLDLLEIGSVSGGNQKLSASLGHQMLYLVNGFLGCGMVLNEQTTQMKQSFSLPGSR